MRQELGAEALKTAGERIAVHLQGLPELAEARAVFCYHAVRAEVPTASLVEGLLATGKRVAIPRMVGDGHMEARLLQHPLVPGPMGIPTSDGPVMDSIDVAICPGLAFDGQGGRLGYGGGYYDRWLSQHGCVVVGVCVQAAFLPQVPVEVTDVPMDVVVTPQGAHRRPRAVRVVAAAWVRDGRVLAAQRSTGPLAGKWELPGGKVEPGETDRDALARELREELAVQVEVKGRLGTTVHDGDGRRIELVAYLVEAPPPTRPVPTEHAQLRWLSAAELTSVDWAPADIPLLEGVRPLLS
ncbi:MAG: 5-formyltetrahydrofolate cyclo-ligase [Myxococcales bacterium]|nr:5-formyltetrahydrofolate cyclo-ligase [Myxococcales bacterium]